MAVKRARTSVLSPGARELTTLEAVPLSVVNTALSETFSDSRLNKILLAGTAEEAFFMLKIRSNSSPAYTSAGSVR